MLKGKKAKTRNDFARECFKRKNGSKNKKAIPRKGKGNGKYVKDKTSPAIQRTSNKTRGRVSIYIFSESSFAVSRTISSIEGKKGAGLPYHL